MIEGEIADKKKPQEIPQEKPEEDGQGELFGNEEDRKADIEYWLKIFEGKED